MAKTASMTRILVGHFFRRFFDNDTVQVDGDTQTTVVRALAAVAVPGLMVAFWLQTAYPLKPLQRPPWLIIEDHYWFVLFTFVVMGAVAVFEWEMLFPDRLDFLILSPLPVKPLQMLGAKAAALAEFLGLFLVSSYIFGGVLLPAVSKIAFFRQLYAHAAAVMLAGLFASLVVLALGGVLVCALNAARFRVVSPVVQMVTVMLLVSLLLQYAKLGDSMQAWLTEPMGWMRWLPPLWFLGLYERLMHGNAAPPFAGPLSLYAIRGTLAAGTVVLLTYPLAWVRMRRMAVEGAARTSARPSRWFDGLLHRVVRRPGERAIFHFVGQTIARNNRYQVYLAMYCGTGLALALGCAVTFHTAGGVVRAGLSEKGLHAAMPLLLFWVVAGLRIAFSFPLNLPAGWVFRITGVRMDECAAAARKWVMLCAAGVMLCVLVALRVVGWDLRHLLVQAVCGVSLCVLLTDLLFFSQRRVPFNQPRMPGRVNFPLMMALWAALPVFVSGVIALEMRLEQHPQELWLRALGVAALHAGLNVLHGRPDEIDEEMEGYEGEFQLLGLS